MRAFTQDQIVQAQARAAAAAQAAEHARQCMCGAPAGIMLFNTRPTSWRNRWQGIPACGPCATALEALGWSPEKEGSAS